MNKHERLLAEVRGSKHPVPQFVRKIYFRFAIIEEHVPMIRPLVYIMEKTSRNITIYFGSR